MKNKIYLSILILILLGVIVYILIPKTINQSQTSLKTENESNQTKVNENTENLPISSLAQHTADQIIQMQAINNWQVYKGAGDMGEFKKVSEGLYNFDKSTNCSTPEWKDHEGCKYFSTSLFIPFVNADQTASVAITIHEAINQDLYNEFLNSYIEIINKNKDRGAACSGGVLQNKDKNLFVNVIPNGGTSEDINAIFEKIKTEFDLEIVHNCAG